MGGTSADVALIRNYEASVGFDRAVAGFPIRLPMLDIHTIGAGGGSIAWFDRDGLLKVGPLSAGADPGPACYGRGGKSATVTDANLVLGRLTNRGLNRRPDAARFRRLPRGAEADRRAPAVFRRANRARNSGNRRRQHGSCDQDCLDRARTRSPQILLAALRRGWPAACRGGCRALGISSFIVPIAPGILCAQGLIASNLKDDIVRSARMKLEEQALPKLRTVLNSLKDEALAWFNREAVSNANRKLNVSLDMRYVGQNFELSVPIGVALGGKLPAIDKADAIRSRFYAVHEQYYGFHSQKDPVEIINVRLTASAAITSLKDVKPGKRSSSKPKPSGYRPVWFTSSKPLKHRCLIAPTCFVARRSSVPQSLISSIRPP